MDIKKIRGDTAMQLLKKRVVVVEGDITDETPVFIYNSLLSLDSQSKKDIFLFFRSDGGQAEYGHLIYDIVRSLRSTTVAVIGHAGSAAGIISQACTKRYIYASGKILIHSTAVTMDKYKFDEHFEDRIESVRRYTKLLIKRTQEIYLNRSSISIEQFTEAVQRGNLYNEWIFAKQAKKLGLVDKIIGDDYKLWQK